MSLTLAHLDLGQLLGGLVSAYLTVVAGLAAITATRAAEEDDREQMGARVVRTLTWCTLGVGIPALVIGAVVLVAQARPADRGTLGLASVLVGLAAATGLLLLWVASALLASVATRVAKELPPLAVGGVVFAFCSLGAPVGLLLFIAGQLAHR